MQYLSVLIVVLHLIVASAWRHTPQIRANGISKKSIAAMTIILGLVSPEMSYAKGGPPGSKTSKKFESCVSTCVFDLTKPAPAGSGVDRLASMQDMKEGEAIRLCKKKCAKTRAQQMTGEPKSQKALSEDAVVKPDEE